MTTQTIQWIRNNPAFCTAPHAAYDLRFQHGKFKVTACCNLDISQTNKDLDFDFLEDVKQQQAQNTVPRPCWRCAKDEQNLAQSERVKLMLGYSVAELTQFKQEHRTTEFQVGMKFSNLCNLACRSCNADDSSMWAKLMNQRTDATHEIDISDNPSYWNAIVDMIRDKHSTTENFIVHPIGGETMIQPGFLKLIDWLIAENLASTTTLRITTSLVPSISEKFLERFAQFRHIEFLSSIDSVGENYHYVRWPARFNKVQDNLATFDSLCQQYPGKFSLSVSPVFSLNNIFYAVDCLDWWEQWAEQTQQNLWLSNIHLYNPEPLMVESLPSQYHPQLIELLEKCVSHSVFQKYKRTDVLREYFVAMLATVQANKRHNESQFDQYLKFTADYDHRTGTNSYILNSKLFDLLSDSHKQTYNSYLQHVQSQI
jgi:transcription termination factor NusB